MFVGGWSLAAAEAVGSGEGIAHGAVLELLAALVDKSLVTAEYADGEARYRFLEPIRQYAAQRLQRSGETKASMSRHAHYYLALAEEAAPHLSGQDQDRWFVRLERERDNVRAALRWFGSAETAPLAVRLVGALWWFWYCRGDYHEGRDALLHALQLDGAHGESGPDAATRVCAARARACLGACALLWRSGDYPAARDFGERGLALYRALAEPQGIAWTLIFLSHVCGPLRDYTAGPAYIAEALHLFREIGDPVGLARTLNALGETARMDGDYTEAEALFTECLALDRATEDQGGLALRLMNMGFVVLRQGDAVRAAASLQESLTLSLRLERTILIANCLDGLAATALLCGQPLVAARLFGAADALYEALHTLRETDPPQQLDYAHYLSLTRGALDAASFGAAWSVGRSLSRDAAVAEALALPVTVAVAVDQALSPCERQVAALIARGDTNAQIAAALGLSRRTADTHVSHILHKLGLTSRTQVAAHRRNTTLAG